MFSIFRGLCQEENNSAFQCRLQMALLHEVEEHGEEKKALSARDSFVKFVISQVRVTLASYL